MKRHSLKLPSVTFSQKNFGGAAMEYIIVSTFAAVISIVAIGFVANIFRSKMAEFGKKLNIETEEIDTELFNFAP
jgi:hypothetical protein